MTEICGDNRFEIIEKAKADLLKSTNIESSEDEMKVFDNFLFRCWQMGWLDKYDDTKVNRLKLVQEAVFTVMNQCKSDTNEDRMARNVARFIQNALDGSSPDFESIEEPKTGHWIIDGCIEMCDQCGERREFPHWNYCPNCGAKMERGNDEDRAD